MAWDGKDRICITRLDNEGNTRQLIIYMPYPEFCRELRAWNAGAANAFRDYPLVRRWLMDD